jgi:hypothetical protein
MQGTRSEVAVGKPRGARTPQGRALTIALREYAVTGQVLPDSVCDQVGRIITSRLTPYGFRGAVLRDHHSACWHQVLQRLPEFASDSWTGAAASTWVATVVSRTVGRECDRYRKELSTILEAANDPTCWLSAQSVDSELFTEADNT